ncbi:MAG TPA: YraN family protein [Actinomycetota bacterium]|nr:YraN family protein [Actinomycetota bacterium]
MDPRRSLGRAGEQLAARRYTRQGFAILDRNYRCPQGEIDIVAAREKLLVFCEVKCRHTSQWGEPSEAVGWRKQQRLRRLAAAWLADRRPAFSELRFDVVSVVMRDGAPEVTQITDAF